MKEILQENIPNITDKQLSQFLKYYHALIDRNLSVNLTAITEEREVAEKHFLDSLLPAAHIPRGAKVIDVGTGAGFPGIPLKIMRPDISLVLLDSLNKRIMFLRELLALLDISAECVHARAEDAAHMPQYRGQMDAALTRAVAPVNVLIELTVPFLKVGGVSLMYKGPAAKEELSAAANASSVMGCSLEMREYSAGWGDRRVVIAKKQFPTKKDYPRKAGTPSKTPL